MSTSPVHRLKDRGGGGKTTAIAVYTKPSKSITPDSEMLTTRTADSGNNISDKGHASRPTSIHRSRVSEILITRTADSGKNVSDKENASRPTSIRWSRVSEILITRTADSGKNVTDKENASRPTSIHRFRVSKKAQSEKSSFRASAVGENVIENSKVGSGRSIEIRKEMQLKNGISRSRVLDVVKISSIRPSLESLNLESNLNSVVKGFEGVQVLEYPKIKSEKVILSNIQETVAGIEKSMGHVVINDDQKSGLGKLNENDNLQINLTEKCPREEVDDTKNSLKGLNTEDPVAMFFPHHKLLRDRTSLKLSSRNHQISETKIEQPTTELKVEQKQLNSNTDLEIYEPQEIEDTVDSAAPSSPDGLKERDSDAIILTSGETQEDFNVQENVQDMKIDEVLEDNYIVELSGIGNKTCTAGWFVSERESALLAYSDGSCSFYDTVNSEEKIEYKPPYGTLSYLWQDCWILHAPTPDGCSGKYVVAASAGNTLVSGYCSWDFYTREVIAENTKEDRLVEVDERTALAPLPNNNPSSSRESITYLMTESRWWYKPCGPLIVWTGTYKKIVMMHDIRDGENILKWKLQRPVLAMEYSSPLQWRSRGKVVIAEDKGISLWDVSNLNYKALMSVSSAGSRISALHVNNTDAELGGGGVRQRVSSSEAEGNDGVFCTNDAINVLDFRTPSGIGLKIPNMGTSVKSIFSRGDSIYLGCSTSESATKRQSCPLIQQFSIRKQKVFSTYMLPGSNQNTDIRQVWGNSNVVMGVCESGLSIFDALKDDDEMKLGSADYEVIGPNDMKSPTFDYSGSRVLLISKDRPAHCKYLL